MVSASAYLRALRNWHKINQTEAGRLAGISYKTVERWESGAKAKRPPTFATLEPLVKALGGLIDDAVFFLTDPDATPEEAEQKAREWLALSDQERDHKVAERAARQMSDNDLQEAINIVRHLRQNPVALDQWLGIGSQLASRYDAVAQHENQEE